MGLITEIKAPHRGHWQTSFMIMMKAPKGQVNIMYDNLDQRGKPWDCREPQDWDALPGGCRLAMTSYGKLNVDCGTKEYPDIISEMQPERTRTFFDCFLIAFRWYWICNSEHDPRLHPSWYEDVENAQ